MALKHVGRVKNTGRRCIVVFREIYNEKGHVIDPDNCLVVETDTLPDAEHQDFMRIIEGDNAQSTGDLYNVLVRERLGNGLAALEWLNSSRRLRKFPTNNIELIPDANTTLGLDTLNTIVKMQKTGASAEDIENVLRDDTDEAPRNATTLNDYVEKAVEEVAEESAEVAKMPDTEASEQPGSTPLDVAAIAKGYVTQAKMLEAQAALLMKQADRLTNSLKPKAKKTTVVKEPAKQKES